MKNKKDILIGIITIIATTGAMIFSINYTSKAITRNAHKNIIQIKINKKDPKFQIKNWGMNRTRTQKESAIERMMRN
jgi:hypothetical protein